MQSAKPTLPRKQRSRQLSKTDLNTFLGAQKAVEMFCRSPTAEPCAVVSTTMHNGASLTNPQQVQIQEGELLFNRASLA
jgi:hypothetical protein